MGRRSALSTHNKLVLYVGQPKSTRNSSDWKSSTTDSIWSKNDHRGETLASLTDPFMRFGPTIWRWDLSVRSLFRAVSASRWRTEPHIACCAAIPRREKHSCHHPTTVLSGSRSEWCSAVPYSENRPQWGRFSHHGGHRIECDGWTPEDSKRSLPPVHPTMAGSVEQVCVCERVRLWRWLGKRCHMSYHYSAIPQFRELCDCLS